VLWLGGVADVPPAPVSRNVFSIAPPLVVSLVEVGSRKSLVISGELPVVVTAATVAISDQAPVVPVAPVASVGSGHERNRTMPPII
jgi:uncharacterized membrane protein